MKNHASIKGQNLEWDHMERLQNHSPEISMSPLLISEFIGKLHHEKFIPSLIKKLSQSVTLNRDNV